MSSSIFDLTSKTDRGPVAYGRQPVRGWRAKHYDRTVVSGSNIVVQKTIRQVLAMGAWEALEKLWADAFAIDPVNYTFHRGTSDDTPDAFFPDEVAHPGWAYLGTQLPEGLDDSAADQLFGIYKTLRTANYDGAGRQIDSGGVIRISGDSTPDPTYFFYDGGDAGINPANAVADQMLWWGKRPRSLINWPAWVDWRDWNSENISWDDAKYTPRSPNLTPASTGTLPADTYYIRVATLRGSDISSASQHSPSIFESTIVLGGANNALQAAWLIKGDEETPPASPSDITGYRVFLRRGLGGTWRWHNVMMPSARSYLIEDFSDVSDGFSDPPNVCTAGLLRLVRRFQCGLFFVPPYDMAAAIDRILQISCADFQWSGLGSGIYRNDMVRFLSPATREPVFTLDLSQTAPDTFHTYGVDLASRPNQIVVNFRDADDPYLGPADPVVLDRDDLQRADGQVKTHSIDGGTMLRSQAQRVASFFARLLCDCDQMSALTASPKTYHVLPGDVVAITNDTPDWTDQQFLVIQKEEVIEGGIGDPMLMRVYSPNLYSDTDHSPLPRPLPARRTSPYSVPPPVIAGSPFLNEGGGPGSDGAWHASIAVAFTFPVFPGRQVATIQFREIGVTAWTTAGTAELPYGLSTSTPTVFAIENVEKATYEVRVLNGTSFVQGDEGDAPDDFIDVQFIPVPAQAAGLLAVRGPESAPASIYSSWHRGIHTDRLVYRGEDPELWRIRYLKAGAIFHEELLRLAPETRPFWIPYMVPGTSSANYRNDLLVRGGDGGLGLSANLPSGKFAQAVSQELVGNFDFYWSVDHRLPPASIAIIGSDFVWPFAADATTDLLHIENHGLRHDTIVQLETTGTLPAPLQNYSTMGQSYIVVVIDEDYIKLRPNTFPVVLTPIDITTAGAGVHTLYGVGSESFTRVVDSTTGMVYIQPHAYAPAQRPLKAGDEMGMCVMDGRLIYTLNGVTIFTYDSLALLGAIPIRCRIFVDFGVLPAELQALTVPRIEHSDIRQHLLSKDAQVAAGVTGSDVITVRIEQINTVTGAISSPTTITI